MFTTSALVSPSTIIDFSLYFPQISGIFTPTVTGLYLLNVHVRGNGDSAHFLIKRNDNVVCSTYSTNTYSATASCTKVLQLTAGDAVKMTGGSDAGLMTSNFRHFTGYLIRFGWRNNVKVLKYWFGFVPVISLDLSWNCNFKESEMHVWEL